MIGDVGDAVHCLVELGARMPTVPQAALVLLLLLLRVVFAARCIGCRRWLHNATLKIGRTDGRGIGFNIIYYHIGCGCC